MIAAVDWQGVSAAIAAFGTLITAAGVVVIGLMSKAHSIALAIQRQALEVQNNTLELHGKTLVEVEKQGNSVALELKRTNMVYARRLAAATGLGSDIAIADDAQKVYEAAAARAIKDSKTNGPAI
jgi:hypothetical protein